MPWHKRGGGLKCGHSPKRGVLGEGTAPQKGGLRCGYNQKGGGVLGTSTTQIFIFYFYFVNMINRSTGEGVFWQAEKGGVLARVLGARALRGPKSLARDRTTPQRRGPHPHRYYIN